MSRFILCFLLYMCPLGTQSTPELSINLIEFHGHYQKFFRKYLGCKPEALIVEECNPRTGILDYREFQAMRKSAIKLFDIHEKE